MKLSEVWWVFAKEVRELMRSKGTVITIVFFPVAVIVLCAIVPSWLVNKASSEAENRKTRLCIFGKADALVPFFRAEPRLQLVAAPPLAAGCLDAIAAGRLDAALFIPEDFAEKLAHDQPPQLVLFDNATVAYAVDESNVKRALDEFASAQVRRRLVPYDIPVALTRKITFRSQSAESDAQRSAQLLGAVCSLSLVVTVLIFSSTAALDAVTGERERGTLSMLLLTGANRSALVAGKLLSVSAVSFLFALTAVVSIALALQIFLQTAHLPGGWNLTIPIANLALSTIFLLPLCLLVAACSLAISSYAVSFQQGQAYFVPLLIFCLVLAAGSLLLTELTPAIVYCVPVLNIAACLHAAVEGKFSALPIALTLASSAVYVMLFFHSAVSMFDSEEKLFGLRPGRSGNRSYSKDALVLFAAAAAGCFYALPWLQAIMGLAGVALVQVLFVALPGLVMPQVCRLDRRQTLRIVAPKLLALTGALLLVPLMTVCAGAVVQFETSALPAADRYFQGLTEFLWPKCTNLVVAYLVLALTPGICEELLFRGAIQGLLRKNSSALKASTATAILFALMHASLARFLPMALIGMVLGTVAEVTGSIIPCMLMHALSNGLAIYCQTNGVQLEGPLLSIVVVSGVLGTTLLAVSRRKGRIDVVV